MGLSSHRIACTLARMWGHLLEKITSLISEPLTKYLSLGRYFNQLVEMNEYYTVTAAV